jgi:hypothetical protein
VTLARSCGYAWAELGALIHLAEIHARLDDKAKAATLERKAETMPRGLLNSTPIPTPSPRSTKRWSQRQNPAAGR